MSKKESKEYRIESLLSAAIEEFMKNGYEGTSVDSIAKKAGVSKGAFYYHFPNKEVLLMEANQKLCEPIIEMTEKALSNKSAIDGLKHYIYEYVNYWVTRPNEMSFLFLSMSKALETPALIDYYKEYIKQSTAFFTCMFEKAVNLGEVNIDDPEAYGISLMGALDGIVSYAMVNKENDITSITNRFEQVWLKKRRYS